MANFIALVYAKLKEKGIDTSGMSTDEAVAKFKELEGENKEEKKETPEDVKKKLNGEKIKAENVKKGETSEDVNKRYNAYKEQNKHYLEEIKKGLGGEKPNQVQVRKAVQHLIEQKGELNGWDANMIKDELGADTTQVQNAFSYMQFNKNKKEQPSEIKDKLNGKEPSKQQPLQKRHEEQIKQLADDKFEDGTYELDTLKPISYKSGYQATFRMIGDNYADEEYKEKVEEFLQASSDGKTSAGKFGGSPEISFHIDDYDTAYQLGKKYNQISIWDWGNNKEIKTGGTGVFADYIKHKK